MKFHTYYRTNPFSQDGKVRACQITDAHLGYMGEEAHLMYSIGMVEFRSTTPPTAGDWVVHRAGEAAFRMTDKKFQEQYGVPNE